jgi:hypothetical protein
MGDPSLPLVTLNRWIENLEAFAISSKIWAAEASAETVMVSGRFLIGRPVEGLTNEQKPGCTQSDRSRLNGSWNKHTTRAHDECEVGHCCVLRQRVLCVDI